MTFTRSVVLFWLYTNIVPLVQVHGDSLSNHRQLGYCAPKRCDFASLEVASFMSNEAQKQKIYNECGISSIYALKNGDPRDVNVFDSENIYGDNDSDLGSPNENCDYPGPGIGDGGGSTAAFPNCVPQGNLLIIQSPDHPESTPNDSRRGGCMHIVFDKEMTLFDMGLMDMEELITITVIHSDGSETAFTNPEEIGNNGFWNVASTESGFYGQQKVVEIKMCIPKSGGLSYIDATDCGKNGGGGGDPHLKLWNSTQYSYHGECDLVLLDNKDFHDGLGMDIHIRTTHKLFYSYIESAAVRIGNDILEFAHDNLWLNGVELDDSDLPTAIGDGFKLAYPTYSATGAVKLYRLYLNMGDYIDIAQYNHFMGVNIHGKANEFGTSVGMLGNYHSSEMLARDGMTVLNNPDQFGAEWQVQGDEPNLFRTLREPQHPTATCKPVPEDAKIALRHLRGDKESLQIAEEACGYKSPEEFEFCVHDVLATNDINMAEAW